MDQYNAEIIPLMKHWFSVYLDQWLWGEKLDVWEDGMDELERRIYISHLLNIAIEKLYSWYHTLWKIL